MSEISSEIGVAAGPKRREFSKDQLQLLFEPLTQDSGTEEDSADDKEPELSRVPKRKRRPRSTRIDTPGNLPVVEELLIPEEVQAAPEQWKEIDRQGLRQLDYQPGHFFWRVTIRPKYVHVEDRSVSPIIEPAPAQLIPRSTVTSDLVAHLLISKYCDHLPFYRQEQIFWERHQVKIPRQGMVQWTAQAVDLLESIYRVMRDEMLGRPYLQIDETPITYLDRTEPGGSAKGYLWTYLDPGTQVIFDWHPSRGTDCLRKFLGSDFRGKIQCDGYASYKTYANENDGVELLGCWAHVRRRFEESKAQWPAFAAWVLHQIQLIYRWERELRETRAGPTVRAVFRRGNTGMITSRLKKVFEKFQTRVLPASGLGKAIAYALNHWEQLDKLLDRGYAYFKDILRRLPTATNLTVLELTPQNWAAARQTKPAASDAEAA